MANEETLVMNQEDSSSNNEHQSAAPKEEKNKGRAARAFATHAAATTAGAGIGASSAWIIEPYYRAHKDDTTSETEECESVADITPTESETATTTHDYIITSDHLQVAHVDDSLSFSRAFAQARAQVGPGGVFAWHGKVYGTYYENEWNSMSAEEHTAWQTKVDYNEALEVHDYYAHTGNTTSHTSSSHTQTETGNTDDNQQEYSTQHSDENTVDDNEVRVIGIAIQDNRQGGIATIGALQHGDDMAVVVDIESDGRLDILASDLNDNGRFEENEILDIRADGKSTAAVVKSYVEDALQHGETPVVTNIDTGETIPFDPTLNDDQTILTSNDDMLGNLNDVDTNMIEV